MLADVIVVIEGGLGKLPLQRLDIFKKGMHAFQCHAGAGGIGHQPGQ